MDKDHIPNGQRLDLVGTEVPGTQNPVWRRKEGSVFPHDPSRAMQELSSLSLSVNVHHRQLDLGSVLLLSWGVYVWDSLLNRPSCKAGICLFQATLF